MTNDEQKAVINQPGYFNALKDKVNAIRIQMQNLQASAPEIQTSVNGIRVVIIFQSASEGRIKVGALDNSASPIYDWVFPVKWLDPLSLTRLTAPSFTGTLTVGEVLTAQTGTWSPIPDSSTYQWMRGDSSGANLTAISGATGATYTLVAEDQGNTIALKQTASRLGYNNDSNVSTVSSVVS